MAPEKRNCQNCKKDFTLEQDDFDFYKKMRVPAPSFCPMCRFQRRMLFRNERALYKRRCDAPGHSEEMISMYAPESPVKVYDYEYWWSDAWDPMIYGRDYDFSRPFFDQLQELIRAVPWPTLNVLNNVNSNYCNFCTDNKNCYLVFGGDFNEDSAYSTFNFHSKEVFDTYWIDQCELCYECVDGANNYRVQFSRYAYSCVDSAFLLNCSGCQNCFGCVNLRNKQYYIFNKPFSREEYEAKIKEMKLGTFSGLRKAEAKFEEFAINMPRRYAEITKSVNSTGNDIHNAKNCKACFDIEGEAEDLKHTYLAGWGIKDAHSADHAGHGSELVYDSFGVFSGARNIAFSIFSAGCRDSQYSYTCRNSADLFGCAGLRNKQYCILNKQYSKEEYEIMVERIKKQMDEMPFTDTAGRSYKYGEFFPAQMSPFAYNESLANEYLPLSQENAQKNGYGWREPAVKNPNITLRADQLPDDIREVQDSILQEVIECEHAGKCNEQCTKAFKLIPAELQFYRRMGLPLPRACSNCRHFKRFRKRNPFVLWKRACACAGNNSKNSTYKNQAVHEHGLTPCPISFETTYSPERAETVYCESCYQQEVS